MAEIKKTMKSVDGNTAAAMESYYFTEVAAIYPITPSSVMAENVDAWAAVNRKNIFGEEVKVVDPNAPVVEPDEPAKDDDKSTEENPTDIPGSESENKTEDTQEPTNPTN